jgi:thiamine-phosphate pyrophosphorylase
MEDVSEMKAFPPLLCLTSDNPKITHDEQVRILIDEGAKFIQIRSKETPAYDLLEQVNIASSYAFENEVILIINDHLELASRSKVSGVHLGEEDHSVSRARSVLGEQAIIGSTVHNFDEAKTVKKLGLSNYVGLGPYSRSKTKFDLNSFLNPEEITEIVSFLYPTPVFLIGGIDLDKCGLISEFNLAGLAVCSSLSSAEHYGIHVKKFINKISEVTCVSV